MTSPRSDDPLDDPDNVRRMLGDSIANQLIDAYLASPEAQAELAEALRGYRIDDVPGHGNSHGDCESCAKHFPAILAAWREARRSKK